MRMSSRAPDTNCGSWSMALSTPRVTAAPRDGQPSSGQSSRKGQHLAYRQNALVNPDWDHARARVLLVGDGAVRRARVAEVLALHCVVWSRLPDPDRRRDVSTAPGSSRTRFRAKWSVRCVDLAYEGSVHTTGRPLWFTRKSLDDECLLADEHGFAHVARARRSEATPSSPLHPRHPETSPVGPMVGKP